MGELGRSLSSSELSEWIAYFRLEPLADPYWIGAMQTSTLVNCLADAKTSIEDFLPTIAALKRHKSAEELMGAMMLTGRVKIEEQA